MSVMVGYEWAYDEVTRRHKSGSFRPENTGCHVYTRMFVGEEDSIRQILISNMFGTRAWQREAVKAEMAELLVDFFGQIFDPEGIVTLMYDHLMESHRRNETIPFSQYLTVNHCLIECLWNPELQDVVFVFIPWNKP